MRIDKKDLIISVEQLYFYDIITKEELEKIKFKINDKGNL